MNRFGWQNKYEKPPLYFDDIGTCYGTAAQNDNYVSPGKRLVNGDIVDEYEARFKPGQLVRVGKKFTELTELQNKPGRLIKQLGGREWEVSYDGMSNQRLKTEWLVMYE